MTRRQEGILIAVGLVLIAMFFVVGYIGGVFSQEVALILEGECAEMFLGDNWSRGYVVELAKQCDLMGMENLEDQYTTKCISSKPLVCIPEANDE